MFIHISNQKKHSVCRLTYGIVVVFILVAGLYHTLLAAEPKQTNFKSADETWQQVK